MAWVLPWSRCVEWLERMEPDSHDHSTDDLTKTAEVRFTIRRPDCGTFYQIEPHDHHRLSSIRGDSDSDIPVDSTRRSSSSLTATPYPARRSGPLRFSRLAVNWRVGIVVTLPAAPRQNAAPRCRKRSASRRAI
jgi:hypothetical protein